MKKQKNDNVIYGIIEETYILKNHRRYSYGIAAYEYPYSDLTASIAVAIHDISSDRSEIAKLVELCNMLKLSPIHLNDVVEDFLSE